jgi:hypothetical protein
LRPQVLDLFQENVDLSNLLLNEALIERVLITARNPNN